MQRIMASGKSFNLILWLSKLNVLVNKFNNSIFTKSDKASVRGEKVATFSADKEVKSIHIDNDEQLNNQISNLQMVSNLQAGIENKEFTLYYQPEYNLMTNEIIGVETLIRWPHPVHGFISPEIFIPVAEKSNQIYELERWIIDKALQQKEQWERAGFNHIELSINMSGKTLESESDFNEIEKIIESHAVDYSKIIFEITETVIINHVDLAIERLKCLRKNGIRIALDDFGTGYSSLTHIMKLPVDIIKIDRCFINSLPKGKKATIITRNILSLANDLKYQVVAEGIETMEQLQFLKKLSCERGQGFLLCKPLSADKIDNILRK